MLDPVLDQVMTIMNSSKGQRLANTCPWCVPLKAGFLAGPDGLGAKVVAASLANLDT